MVSSSSSSESWKANSCDVLCLQEIHRGVVENRPKIVGLELVVERPHDLMKRGLPIKDTFLHIVTI